MVSSPRAVAFLTLAAAVACGGPGANEQLENERQAICNGLVAQGQSVAQASAAFGFTPDRTLSDQAVCQFTDATQGWVLPPGNSCPDATTICEIVWQVSDPTVCGANGCVYACVAYLPEDPDGSVSDTSVVCGAKFVSGQPGF